MDTRGMLQRFRSHSAPELTVKRFEGVELRDGKFEHRKVRVFKLDAISVQPIRMSDNVIAEFGGRRNVEWFKIYSDCPLRVTDDKLKQKADIVVINGDDYEVRECQPYNHLNLQHYKILVVSVANNPRTR